MSSARATHRWMTSKPSNNPNNTSDDFNYEGCTIREALQSSIIALQQSKYNNVPEPTLSACHLLSFALKLPSSNGFSMLLQCLEDGNTNSLSHDDDDDDDGDRLLTQMEAQTFSKMCHRRALHEPIQYVLGEWDFYDFTLKCRAPILCPRPETEELVDWVRTEIIHHEQQHTSLSSSSNNNNNNNNNNKKERRMRILDVGCGTGAIGLALAREFPQAQVVAIDISEQAVRLAMENAKMLNLLRFTDDTESNGGGERAVVVGGSNCRYQAILSSASDFTNVNKTVSSLVPLEFDYVVSNPPYIPPKDMPTLARDVIDYESREALCGGGHDGLDVIRDIINLFPEWTNHPNNNNNNDNKSDAEPPQNDKNDVKQDTNARIGGMLWMEVDTSHPALIEQIWGSDDKKGGEGGGAVRFVESKKDLCGRDRFVKLQIVH